MTIAIISNDVLKQEWLATGQPGEAVIKWIAEPSQATKADAVIDLLFTPASQRIDQLNALGNTLVLVNAVTIVPGEIPRHFVRFNGWPGFLKRSIAEAASGDPSLKEKAENIFSLFNRKTSWVPDQPGFISARVISMIINEAFYALEEAVSTREEMDIAMKLGTNYPYGPFEWGALIGYKNIYELLDLLHRSEERYKPAGLLKKEAGI